jgi:hypothetical protein
VDGGQHEGDQSYDTFVVGARMGCHLDEVAKEGHTVIMLDPGTIATARTLGCFAPLC